MATGKGRKNVSRNMQRRAEAGTDLGSAYPVYLQKEYKDEYQYKCTQTEFYPLVKKEINACRVSTSEKNKKYKLWFGKYSGRYVHELTDMNYFVYLSDVFRKTNPELVAQVLIRMDDLTYDEYGLDDEDENDEDMYY